MSEQTSEFSGWAKAAEMESSMEQDIEDDQLVVKSVWKSAHAVEDWPGMVTIRRFSPFKKIRIEGEGKTVAEAWKNTADKIRAIWNE